MRYFLPVASFGIGRVMEPVYLVIETDDHAGAIARGFAPIDEALSDDEVKQRYGVSEFIRVVVSAAVN